MMVVSEMMSTADGFEGVVGNGSVMHERIALARRVAECPTTVLITGPSGVGKEVFARAIHRSSNRAGREFVPVNCAAIPENLLESELFGHRRGSFTGAVSDKSGLFQEADGGTLFLDEVGEMPLSLQAKLLRALQEREVRPIGAMRPVPFDVRVIAATNCDLRAAMVARSFREDLFYRLSVFELSLPPLAARIEDIAPLAERFAREACARAGRPALMISEEARLVLRQHSWPGNIRELQNAIERAVVLASGDAVMPADLPSSVRNASEPLQDFLTPAVARHWTAHDLVLAFAKRMLSETRGNKKAAARMLGIDRRTLHRWLDECAARGETAPRRGDG